MLNRFTENSLLRRIFQELALRNTCCQYQLLYLRVIKQIIAFGQLKKISIIRSTHERLFTELMSIEAGEDRISVEKQLVYAAAPP